MRLDKYLADADLGTRSQVKLLIKQKMITVDDQVITDSGFQIKAGQTVRYKQAIVHSQGNCYYMFHKPAGCVCATIDRDQTVMNYFKPDAGKNLFPVGRLDKDTEGLLLVSNDGAFSHELMSPKKHVSKLYYFEAMGFFLPNTIELIAGGMDIGDEKLTKPAGILAFDTKTQSAFGNLSGQYVNILENEMHTAKNNNIIHNISNTEHSNNADDAEKNNSNTLGNIGIVADTDELIVSDCKQEIKYFGLLEISEGRYHQVKRMLKGCGVKVTYLKRIAIGRLFLDNSLKPGSYRRLTDEELLLVKNR